ncbi:DUF4406 domain-containing protein [Bacteroides hominis]|uniref:DUF4406 domain-containing protein n=1 Tax=Bacteroides stercoris ATCC 43183 TaxID=449673 RepID=B0NU56_BACSE|nr:MULTISPECIES: DUF4406 domain-containing protein [Bacteroides]EDS13899.1 hypothetical protein BACSTE_03041 [Bacteroides stercoris ATCC 43183]MCY2673619.1 DUF4406 domain-containing protein [Bacteroides fragilis]MDA1492030.1 DUF4406 domain-containing protein [Bacteroides fragilis]UWO03748.1 DUF4406 domain-containing protein [Bacteroides stercoris ATCC 43183]SDX64413.1 protein of unknown function [Bacteroides stercoris]
MKIYISGQITGLKEKEAKIYFDRAEKMLLEKGYNPVNPMRINPPIKNKSWKDYMIDDLRLLFDCEAIYLIDNWQMSKGARIEYYIAKELGMSIIETIE